MYEKDENLNKEQTGTNEETKAVFNTAPEEAHSAEQGKEDFILPPQGRYTCYSDGSSKNISAASRPMYSPNGAPYGYAHSTTAPKPQKSILGVVLASVGITLLICALVWGVVVYGPKLLSADKNSTNGGEESAVAAQSGVEKLNGADYESIPEIVTINPTPEEGYDSLVDLYNKRAPSCVTIKSTVEYNNGFYTQEGVSLGSGFVIEGKDPKTEKTGFYIITNHHVIEDAKSIDVKFYDDSTYTATLIGSDEMTDIAVLSIEKTDLVPLQFGDSDSLMVGQWVVAIGTPSDEEFAGTMSYGIISGVNRDLQITNSYGSVVKTMTVIQTTATLNPGNSGGPLIDMSGQVVGINAMKLSESYESMGFALPASSAKNIINSLIAFGEVVDRTDSFVVGSAKLGITGATVSDDIKDDYRLGEDCPDGVLVTNVSRGTAVYEAGLSIYDVITEFDGKEIKTIEELQAAIKEAGAGKKVVLKFYRPGRLKEEGDYHTISFVLDYAN